MKKNCARNVYLHTYITKRKITEIKASKIKQAMRNVSKQRRHRKSGWHKKKKNTYENYFQCHWTSKNFKSTLCLMWIWNVKWFVRVYQGDPDRKVGGVAIEVTAIHHLPQMRTALNEDDVEDAYFTSPRKRRGEKENKKKNPHPRAFQFALHHWEKVESRFNGSVTF